MGDSTGGVAPVGVAGGVPEALEPGALGVGNVVHGGGGADPLEPCGGAEGFEVSHCVRRCVASFAARVCGHRRCFVQWQAPAGRE
ncbi:MAG TPA: hypothetical protein VKG38_05545 [Solirubrobacteraceae bacterium]|nr:hypothetical protein [Solirubrobacteraceae bacterium]